MMTKVLIGIISKNRAKILPKAIDSAMAQTLKSKNLTVFDDNSTDDTKMLVDKYSNVKWIFNATNHGYLYGRNKLMAETNAEYYCSLDDDAWFLEGDELALAINYLDNHHECAAIAYDILSPDRPGKEGRGKNQETNMFIGCGHVLRLSALEEVGYYTPNPGFYGGEEKDLCLRLIDHGYRIIKMQGVHVWHDKTMVSRNLKKQHRSGVCNDMVFTLRRCPYPLVIWATPMKFLKHLKFAIQNNLTIPFILGLIDFLKTLRNSRASREAVSMQAFRKYMKLSRT